MKTKKIPKKNSRSFLPDVSEIGPYNNYSSLNRVGMSGIETMVKIVEDEERNLPAQVDVFVDLVDPKARGIHMSRIYQILYKKLPNHKLTPRLLQKVLKECVKSQQGISTQSTIRLSFTLPQIFPSLLSGHEGYRHYPIVWEGKYKVATKSIEESFTFYFSFQLLYSSTCPCSTALSEDFQRWSKEFDGYLAIPHAQRSKADITIGLRNLSQRYGKEGFMAPMIRKLEKAIKTPVQTAVKREDELEFARLNAKNQMFCEDAARILKMVLEKDTKITDYRIQVRHLESLHAHDAVVMTVKGIPGGLSVN